MHDLKILISKSKKWGEIKSLLKKYGDNRKIIFEDIKNYPSTSHTEGLAEILSFPDKIECYLDPNLEETLLEAILVHEFLHMILRLEGFPEIIIRENPRIKDSFLLDSLAKLIRTVLDHLIIHKKMEEDWDLDMQSYFQSFLENRIRLMPGMNIINEDPLHSCLVRQQRIINCLEYFSSPPSIKEKLLIEFGKLYPEEVRITKQIYKKISKKSLSDPNNFRFVFRTLIKRLDKYSVLLGAPLVKLYWRELFILDAKNPAAPKPK